MTPTDQTALQLNVEAARLMSQCLLYTTGRDYFGFSEQLQRLFRVLPGRSPMMPPNFLRIDSVGDSLEARSDPALALQTSLAACAGEESREVVFLVRNDGQKNRVYLGVRHANGFADSFIGSFQHFFRWVHPGSQLTPVDPRGDVFVDEVSRPLERMTHGVCLTGIPSAKISRSDSLVSCLDSLLTGLHGRPFSYFVVARPMRNGDVAEVVTRCRDLIDQFHGLVKQNYAQGVGQSYSRASGESHTTAVTHSKDVSKGVNKIGLAPILAGTTGVALSTFPPVGLLLAMGTAGLAPWLSLGRTESSRIGVSTTESVAHSMTETFGISQSSQITAEILNTHAQAAERHLEQYVNRFYSGRATGMWNVEVYCLSELPEVPILAGAQIQAVLNGADSALEPVRWHRLDELMAKPLFQQAMQSTENAPVLFGADGNTFRHPLGRSYEGLGTPLTTSELTFLLNFPRREIPGIKVVSTASFGLNSPEPGSEPSIPLGNLIDNGVELELPFSLPLHSLAKHALLAGINGSGKSTTCRLMIAEVAENGIPFLVVEPAKDEYVEWAMDFNSRLPLDDPRRIAVFIPGLKNWRGHKLTDQLILNPLEVVWLSSNQEPRVDQHIDGLQSILAGSLPMADILPVILEELLYAVYEQHPAGWIDGTPDFADVSFPTMTSLAAQAKPLIDATTYEPRFKGQLAAALNKRIGSLTRKGWKHRLFNPEPTHVSDWAKLFDRPAVVNLSQITSRANKAFTMALLLHFLYEYRVSQALAGVIPMNAGRLRHLAVIEEAHRVMERPPPSLVGDANPQAMAAQMFSDILSEIRAYGQGFLIVEQVPERLIADAVKNTNLKVVHRLVSKDDRDALAGCMNLSSSQAAMISRLRPGQAIISGDGDDTAYWIKVKPTT